MFTYPAINGVNHDLTNLIAAWPLNETSGTRSDAYASYDLNDNNSVGYTTGLLGNAADFDGGDWLGNLTATALGPTSAGDWSCCGWVKSTLNLAWNNVISKGVDISLPADHGFTVLIGAAANTLRFYLPSSSTFYYVESGTFSVNTWYWFYSEWDKTANKIRISLNNGTLNEATGPTAPNSTTGHTLHIGVQKNSGRFWRGPIEQCLMWARKLSSDDRAYWYNGGAGRAF